VVSSAFGTGADWESEFLGDAERYWLPMFDNLRLYLTRFPGQRATVMEAGTDIKGAPADVAATMRAQLGANETGARIDLQGLTGEVTRISDIGVLVRLINPERGYLALVSYPTGDGIARANVTGYYFGDDAAAVSTRQQASWSEWLDRLPAAAG
jgi:hypothetical protein